MYINSELLQGILKFQRQTEGEGESLMNDGYTEMIIS